MPARPGNWPLLDRDSDPVDGDPDQLHDLIAYYTKIADTITSEARSLEAIAGGDTAKLKGEAADAVRKRSGDVAKSLNQTAGRYEAVRDALTAYGPQLDTARTESLQALNDAEAAEGSRSASTAMADPGANRPSDAPPLTDEENASIHARTTAMQGASDAAGAARQRLESTMSALNAAGQAASKTIRAAWNDGLVDTWQYKLREGFLKFLKILVKVLMWIGVALAVLAFFVPGLGALALAGAAVAVMSLAASTVLAAMGEGSWLDVILGAVAVLMLGAGAIIAKVVQTAHVAALSKGALAAAKPVGSVAAKAKTLEQVVKINNVAKMNRAKVFENVLNGKVPAQVAKRQIEQMDKFVKKIEIENITKVSTKITSDFKVKPQFWNIRHPEYFANDIKKIGEFGGKYNFERLFSIDRVKKFEELRGVMQADLGIAKTATPAWHYFNGGRVVFGWANTIFKLGTSTSGAPGDTTRWTAFEDAKKALTTPKV